MFKMINLRTKFNFILMQKYAQYDEARYGVLTEFHAHMYKSWNMDKI